MYFPNYRLRKKGLAKRLYKAILEVSWTRNIGNGPKDCWNLSSGTFTIFCEPFELMQLEKIYVSAILNVKTVC